MIIQAASTGTTTMTTTSTVSDCAPGDNVSAIRYEDGGYFNGVINRRNQDGSIMVSFDDGVWGMIWPEYVSMNGSPCPRAVATPRYEEDWQLVARAAFRPLVFAGRNLFTYE